MKNYSNLEQELLLARKSNDIIKKNLLMTIKGEVETELKKGFLEKNDILINIVKKMIKSLSTINNSISHEEIKILEEYLPKKASKQEIKEFIDNSDIQHPGKLIGATMQHFNKNVDIELIHEVIKEKNN